jgi:hypothetical protein
MIAHRSASLSRLAKKLSLNALPLLLIAGIDIDAARPQQTPDRDAAPLLLENDRIQLSVSLEGGRLARLLLKGSEPLSPFHSLGHFLALDGFGAPSDQEKAAGMPFHGEAGKQVFKVLSATRSGPVHSLVLQASLPLAAETLTRTLETIDGENIIYVSNALQSELAIDRPISWAEHVTVGPPFLQGGSLAVDLSGDNCRVRSKRSGQRPGRLIPLRDFKWPMAPTQDGGEVDLRLVPANTVALDLATCQMDPTRKLAFVTALQLEKRLLLGYVFQREQYPWLMSWMNYTGDDRAARGMEFSTQPFDISHRETVDMGPLFGSPVFRWLPAKSKTSSKFLLFYTAVPEGFRRVDNVALDANKLIIEDAASGQRIVLRASEAL